MTVGPLVVSFPMSERSKAIVTEMLGDAAGVTYLTEAPAAARAEILCGAGAVLSNDIGAELSDAERRLIGGARLLQFTAAGIDWVPILDLPPGLPVAGNGGASAEPMAEHVVALALGAAKRLFIEHDRLKDGEFNQRAPNKMLRGGVCGILGFGGVGAATARLVRAFGMTVHAINRSGKSDEPLDWIGTPDRLDEMLAAADLFVVCVALTRDT
ncbi:MAG: NAD(P)-dependent oxidoreductase, partial [Stellaceae bacterium]